MRMDPTRSEAALVKLTLERVVSCDTANSLLLSGCRRFIATLGCYEVPCTTTSSLNRVQDFHMSNLSHPFADT